MNTQIISYSPVNDSSAYSINIQLGVTDFIFLSTSTQLALMDQLIVNLSTFPSTGSNRSLLINTSDRGLPSDDTVFLPVTSTVLPSVELLGETFTNVVANLDETLFFIKGEGIIAFVAEDDTLWKRVQ